MREKDQHSHDIQRSKWKRSIRHLYRWNYSGNCQQLKFQTRCQENSKNYCLFERNCFEINCSEINCSEINCSEGNRSNGRWSEGNLNQVKLVFLWKYWGKVKSKQDAVHIWTSNCKQHEFSWDGARLVKGKFGRPGQSWEYDQIPVDVAKTSKDSGPRSNKKKLFIRLWEDIFLDKNSAAFSFRLPSNSIHSWRRNADDIKNSKDSVLSTSRLHQCSSCLGIAEEYAVSQLNKILWVQNFVFHFITE